MKTLVATAALAVLMAGGASAPDKGGKLPWYDGTPQKGLALAKKEGRNAFLYFTSKG